MASPQSPDTAALSIINHPPRRMPGPALLHNLVPLHSPYQLPALCSLSSTGEESSISYPELHEASDRLASKIAPLVGDVPENTDFVVPLLIPQGPSLYTAIFAILKVGGAFCPLPLDAPPERIGFIIKDVGARITLVTAETADQISAADSDSIILDVACKSSSDQQQATERRSSKALREPGPDDLAYVMYTSGSTGTPKGVGISHDAATQSLLSHDRHIPKFKRFLQFASPTFDVSVFEIFFPLFRGCTLVTCDRVRMLDDLSEVMRRMDVDACELTPTVAGSLLQSRANVPSLKFLLTIGEMLTDRVVQEFGGTESDSSMLWGMYGPTEATIHCTLQVEFSANSSPRSIGMPLDTVSCFVAEIPDDSTTTKTAVAAAAAPEFKVVQIGEVGELVVGGHQLARDYLNRPEQTAAAFVDSPYGRLYRTGDKAKMRHDGSLECLGRISDGQVKLRGQRIELGEVEQAALCAEGCRLAVAMVIESILVVFCLCDGGVTPSELELRVLDACRRWLPAFMVPGDVVAIMDLPKLASGKVDRKKLRQDYAALRCDQDNSSNNNNTIQDQGDPFELQVAQVISDVLRTPVSTSGAFSNIGLDSLSAIMLVSVLRKSGGIQTSSLEILTSRSVSDLCAKIQARESSKNMMASGIHSENAPFKAINLEDVFATNPELRGLEDQIQSFDYCTPLQVSMLVETSNNASAYFNQVEISFPESCSAHQISEKLHQLASANDILRSGFVPFTSRFARVIFRGLRDTQIRIVDKAVLADDLDGDLMLPFRAWISEQLQGHERHVVLQMHHAIYDGWTVDLLTQDLSSLIEDRVLENRPSFHHVSSFHHTLSPAETDSSRSFWADYLRDWRAPQLPRLMSRPPEEPGTRIASGKLSVTPQEVDLVASESGWNPQVLFQASIICLWASILGTSDVVIGSVSSGRTVPVDDIERIMGPCIATTPLRANLDSLGTGGALLKTIQKANRDALQHGLLPLSDISKAAGASPGEALYDVLFVYQQSLYSSQRHTGSVREVAHRDHLETKVLVEVEPTKDAFDCQITYHTDALLPEHAQILIIQLGYICGQLLNQLSRPIADIWNNLPSSIGSVNNPTPASFSGRPDLAASFEHTASLTPEATALFFAQKVDQGSDVGRDVSYHDLNCHANQIAWYLWNNHSESGGTIAVIMDKSVELYAAILGVLKAGFAYLPLLPTTPPERIRTIFHQASITACLVDSETTTALRDADISTCDFIDVLQVDLSHLSTENPRRQVDGPSPAYIIYTSGTTGTPKGIVLTHLNITSNLDALARIYPADNRSRFLQLCSQAFDVSVFEIFFTWTIGGCLCAGTNDTLFADLEKSIRTLGCTHLSLTPTVAALIDPRNVPLVQFLVTAGEPMTDAVARRWQGRLFQGYGPAETTNICSVKKMSGGDFINHLGFVLPNTSALVLHPDNGTLLPIGAYGELCFGGDQVAEGYVKLPDLTSSKFITHRGYGRIYRSGDMGRMLADGSLLVLGRLDGQVKLRGQRIETGEIDTIITSSGIATSSASLIVHSKDDSSSADQLVSFFVPHEMPTRVSNVLAFDESLIASSRELFRNLTSRLPTYMVPTYLVPIDDVPLTSSGKINKSKLREYFGELTQEYLDHAAAPQTNHEDEGDWTEDEKTIAKAVARTVNCPVDAISRWQSLYTLGLDSISAIALSRALESDFHLRLSISSILKNACVARLAQQVLSKSTKTIQGPSEFSSSSSTSPLLTPEVVEHVHGLFKLNMHQVHSVLPCTPLQEAMLSTSRGAYLNQLLLRMHIPASDMETHWANIAKRHYIFRTCFITTPDAQNPIVQVVLRDHNLRWTSSDHATLAQGKEYAMQQVPEALDSQVPPYALHVLSVQGELFLTFSCHHALYDGESMRILIQEVERSTRGELISSPPPYEPVLRHILDLPESTATFWKSLFQGFRPMPSMSPPAIQVAESSPTVDGETSKPIPFQPYYSNLDTPLSELLRTARGSGTSLLSVVQAVWAITVSLLRGQSDVCFGNVMSGRTIPVDEVENLSSPCFNTVPLRTEVSSAMLVTELLKHLQTLNSDLIGHQFTPLRLINKLVSSTSQPLFDTILLLQPEKQALDPAIWELIEDRGSMDVPIVCEVTPDKDGDAVHLSIHSNSPNYPAERVILLADLFNLVTRRIALHPAGAVPDRNSLPDDIRLVLPNPGVYEPQDRQLNVSDLGVKSLIEPEIEQWSGTETRVRQVLSRLSATDMPKIKRHTTIFQLGLDSINAVQVAALLRQMGYGTSTLDVMQCPSCATLAERIESQYAVLTTTQAHSPSFNLENFQKEWTSTVRNLLSGDHEVEKVLPCTPVQGGMLADFIQSRGHDYFNYLCFKLSEQFGLEEVKNAWSLMMHRYSILRTGFLPIDDHDISFAMVCYSPGFPLPIDVYSDSNPDTRFNEEKWRLDCAHRTLRTLEEPTWRVALVQDADNVYVHLAIHHALYDAHSLQALLQSLGHILTGKEPWGETPLEPALSTVIGSALEENQSKEYWQNRAPRAVVNKFPTMTPLIEASSSLSTERLISCLSPTALSERAKSGNISIQALIYASWSRLLCAYLGEDDVVFGTVLAGRTTSETQDVLMPCINTIPIIARNEPSNAALLDQMMQCNSELVAHQHAPLSRIQQWLGHPGTGVFDTLVVYQKPSDTPFEPPWQEVCDEGRLNYPVSLEIQPNALGELSLQLSFREDVIPKEQAKVILQQFDATLNHLALYPTGQDTDTWGSHSHLVSISPPKEYNIPSEEVFLHQFVETAARVSPTRLALEFVTGFRGESVESQTWSFADLDRMGNRVANILAPYAKTGGIIAIHFDKTPEAIFSILGILKAGCAFLALDPTAPTARKEFILEDSGALALLVVRSSSALDFRACQPVLEVSLESLKTMSDQPYHPQPPLDKSDTCYCLYTSGTTGTPKGCEITHENSVQAMKAFQRLFSGHWDEDSRWLQFASFHFDVSVLEQYWSWSVGMPLIMAPRDLILDDIAATIRRLRITHIDLTPSLARLLDPKDVPTLCKGVFITGGEALKQEILDVWGPEGVIYNAYGPTEATIGVTMYQRVPQNGRASNIGRQFDNVGTYVLSPGTDIPVPKGAIGELCVSGKLVGKGYLNRPDLTAERFPLLANFGERVYRTGDLVRLLHDGCFEFLGRSDDQVKLRGQRLEIGEINYTIRIGVPAVQNVATLVAKHPKVDKDLLVTFVTVAQNPRRESPLEILNGGDETTELRQTVQAACRSKLPGYMVPSYVFEVSYIPLSVNNKADMKVLVQLFKSMSSERLLELSSGSVSSNKPTTNLQKTLISVVEDFAHVSAGTVSLGSNLFDFGLDSISSLRLSRTLKLKGIPSATPTAILKNPVLSDLARVLSKSSQVDETGAIQEATQRIHAFDHRYRSAVLQELPSISNEDIEYLAPCTPLQEGMLSRSLSQGEESYFVTFSFELHEQVSTLKLQEAWRQLVSKHAILRTSFVQTTGGFAQVALKETREDLWRELVTTGEHGLEVILAQSRLSWMIRNRHQVVVPLELLAISHPSGRRLVVQIFHAVYDGASFDSMLEWVAREYHGLELEHPRTTMFIQSLPFGPLRDYSSTRQFWSTHLEDCNFQPFLKTTSSSPKKTISTHRQLPTHSLESLRKQANTTLQSVLLAIWSLVLKKHYNTNSATGVVVSGRSIDVHNAEDIIGPLFNTLPFYADLQSQSWTSLVQRCHDYLTTTLEFQHAPLRSIQKWFSGGHAIFDNLFVFQIDQERANSGEGQSQSLWTPINDFTVSDYPLAFEATLSGDQLKIQVVSNSRFSSPSDLDCLLDSLEGVIEGLGSGSLESALQVSQPVSRESSPTASPRTTSSYNDSLNPPSTGLSPPELNISGFDWTRPCRILRQEIAALAELSLESVTETSSMLELGLDSIDLVSLSARLKKRGVGITTSQLLKARTIMGMSQIIDDIQDFSSSEDTHLEFEKLKDRLLGAVSESGFDMTLVEDTLPPTPLQESMMADMLESDFDRYFNHDVLELAIDADVARLSRAWEDVITRSPILRTVFAQVDDPNIQQTFCQVVLKGTTTTIQHYQSTNGQVLDDIMRSHEQYAREQRGRGGLLSLSLVETPTAKYLILSMAHVLYDGWSLALIHQDVEAAYYRGEFRARPSASPTLRALLESPSESCRGFWTQYLSGAQPSLISATRPTPETAPGTLHRAETTSSTTLSSASAFGREHGISLQALGEACWAAVLASQLTSVDVTFGVILSGRDTEEAQHVLFPTMNTVAVRCVLHGSAKSFLGYIQDTMADIHQHQTFPLRRAQAAANRGPGTLFNTLFLLQRHPQTGQVEGVHEPLARSVGGSSTTDFAVCVELEAIDDTLVWRIAGQDAYITEAEVIHILHQLDRVMERFIRDPAQNLLDFQGDQISVIGLPAFRPRNNTSSSSGQPTTPSMSPSDQENAEPVSWSDVERIIRETLSEVSGVEESAISKDSTCYHLGVDSIGTIKVSSLLRKRGLRLGPRQLLAAPSITAVAAIITEQEQAATNQETTGEGVKSSMLLSAINTHDILRDVGLSEHQVEDMLPALPMQVYMMTSWQNSSGQVFYPTFHYQVKRSLGLGELQSAWERLVAAEPILRTCLVATGQQKTPFLQVILKPEAGGCHLEVGSGSKPNVPTNSSSECRPLVRLSLVERRDGVQQLDLHIHHALYDAVSLQILMGRLEETCLWPPSNSTASTIHSLADDWRGFIASHSESSTKQARRDFWTHYLQDVPPSRAPLPEPSRKPAQRVSCFKPAVVRNMSPFHSECAKSGIGIPSLLFAAVAKVLQRKRQPRSGGGGGGDVVVFGIYYANRHLGNGLDEGTFPTLNLLPLRVSVAGDVGVMRMAEQIQQDLHLVTSSVNSTVGLWEIKEWTGAEVDVFVNFLSGVAGDADADAEAQWLEPTARPLPDAPSSASALASMAEEAAASSSRFTHNAVRDAFPDALDIEASVQTGALDVGVFGSESVISAVEAEDWIVEIGSVLGSCVFS